MIFVCTSNLGKTREFARALAGVCPEWAAGGHVRGFADVSSDLLSDYQEPVEDADYFAGNAWKKLKAALTWWNRLASDHPRAVLVDDSGLCVPGLGGRPGVHSAYYAGHPRSDQKNRELLADEVKQHGLFGLPGAAGSERRLPAYFVCNLLCLERVDGDFARGTEPFDLAALSEAFDQSGWSDPHREAELLRVLGKSAQVEGWSSSQEQVSACGDTLSGSGFRLHIVHAVSRGFISQVEQSLIKGEGHGYDAIFYPLVQPDRSFASIPLNHKNSWSHRGAAVNLLADLLRS